MPGLTPPGTALNAASYGASKYPISIPAQRKLYGAVPAEEEGSGASNKGGLMHLPLSGKGNQRARIDFTQILLNVLLPVAIFAIAFAALTFKLHYNYWPFAWIIAICCSFPGLLVLWLNAGDQDTLQGKWAMLLSSLCLVAWLLALVLGSMNYSENMKPFYDMSGLNYSPSVDPSLSSQLHIDIGRMLFTPGSKVDVNRAMGVKIGKTYCVAPVINPKSQEKQYDFWAIGTDCCSSVQPETNWHCGDINNPAASAGMRLMSDQDRPFYRMAVQEAEATYKLRANHPIFITWMQDPGAEMTAWRNNGMRTYLTGVFSVFVLMFFLSFSAGLFFARAAMQSHECKGIGFQKYVGENLECDFLDEEGCEEAILTKSITT